MDPSTIRGTLRRNDAALQDHCRRVGGIANLIAHQLFLPSEQKDILHTACLRHHDADAIAGETNGVTGSVGRVLVCVEGGSAGSSGERTLAAILRLADAYDSAAQADQLQNNTAGLLAGLRSGIGRGLWPRNILQALHECAQPAKMPSPEEWRIPVFPQAAMRTLEAMRNPKVSVPQVVEAARQDPATAGSIMQLANSVLYSERGEVATLQMAVARLGFETACKVVTTLAIRPLLFIPKLASLWPHSIEVAELAEQLAVRGNRADPAEAYLAGLLHDVGRIALCATTLYDSARLHGLQESRCPAVYAEELILRTNHAQLGTQIARMWRLPERLVRAVQRHHHPELATDALPCLLYLAEHLSDSDEDLPSRHRMNLALSNAGLVEGDLEGCVRSGVGDWLAAA